MARFCSRGYTRDGSGKFLPHRVTQPNTFIGIISNFIIMPRH